MMMIGIFLFLGAWQGVMGSIDSDDVCDRPAIRTCSQFPEEVARFPKTEEDLNRLCPHIQQYIGCLKLYADKCGFENIRIAEFTEDSYPVLKDLLDDMCDEDSRLHASVARNLGCFDEVFIGNSTQTCHESTQKKVEKIWKHDRAIDAENNYDQDAYNPERWLPLQCVGEAILVSCFASEVSATCGSDGKETMLEVYSRSGSVDQNCLTSSEERIAELIKILELEMEEEAALRKIMGME